jgi:HSP20 family protein
MARRTHFFVQTFRNASPEYGMAWLGETHWQPRVDIYQTEHEILIHVEAAGVREDDLRLHFENGNLVVEGRRDRPAVPCPQHALQVEISYGEFRRVLPLPRDIDGDNIRAEYSEGLLRITVPRRQRETHNVKINVG